MVSKPVAPPWNDSSKNLVKDLARAGNRYNYRVMTPRGFSLDAAHVTSEPIYGDGGAHTPALTQNLRVLGRLLRSNTSALAHFFFAPNPKSSAAARLALFVRPRPSVQTVCSIPARLESARWVLFADRIVVLSRHTHDAFVAAGVDSARLTVIPPGIALGAPLSDDRRAEIRRRHDLPSDHQVVIYPGDYQFSNAADTVAKAAIHLGRKNTTLIFACRIKQDASRVEEARIKRLLGEAGLGTAVRFYNQVDDILDLVGASDLCLLPAESLYAKMDLPLVLIEAMALGVPIVVADKPPLSELLADGGGIAVPPLDHLALAQTISELLDAPRRRAELAREAIASVRSRYCIDAVSRAYEDLYDEIIR